MTHGRLVICGEGRLFREGLRHILQGPGISVVAEARSLVEIQELLPTLPSSPNLVVCDPSANPDLEYAVMKQISCEMPELGIIVLSRDASQEWLDLARAAGARGFLPNDISPVALQMLLELVLMGENIFAGPSIIKTERQPDIRPTRSIGQDLKIPLSPKEVEILQCLEGGMPNKVIARNLNIAEATVKVHLKSLLRKINVGNRTQAAIWAINRRPESNGQLVNISLRAPY
jgi:two-component system, NarL family, nitrate/nitrite response regulator NarL